MKEKKKKKKTIVICVLLLLITVGGVLAYLTSMDTVVNTFTVGDVKIELDEADVNEKGELELNDDGTPKDRVKENAYHLLPALTYIKDPTVTVKADSEDSYIRMLINIKNIDQIEAALPVETWPEYYDANGVFKLNKILNGMNDTVWNYIAYNKYSNEDGILVGEYEFYYKNIVLKSDSDTVLEPLFESITVPAEIDNEHLAILENLIIEVEAHAIQAAGITEEELSYVENAASAWAKFENSNSK